MITIDQKSISKTLEMQVYWNIHVKYVLNPILLFKKCTHTFSKGTVNEATQLFHIF